MIKLFLLIIALSAPFASSQSFGLFTIADQPLELLKLETQVKVEGESYATIQYTLLYKNSLNNSVETKFVFPPTSNAIIHNFEATFHNQTFALKVGYEFNETNFKENLGLPMIQPNETFHAVFTMIQSLDAVVSKFYELKLPAFFPEDSLHLGPEHWNIQIELESRDEFVVLSNPTHRLVPEISKEGDLFKAFWNVTVAPNEEFAVYFGPEDLKNYILRLIDSQDPNANMMLYNFVLKMESVNAREAQNIFENTTDGLSKIKKLAYQAILKKEMRTCYFVVDRSDSMKGASLQLLKKALKVLLIDVASYCGDFHIVSFGSDFEHHSGLDNIQKAIEWVNTIEADMGGSNLAKALKSLPLWHPTIILTDGDVSESLREESYFVVGISEASKDFIKGGFRGWDYSVAFVTDHKDLEDRDILNFLLRLNRISPECAFTFEGSVDEDKIFYKSNRRWFSLSYEFVDYSPYSRDANLKTCKNHHYWDVCHGGIVQFFADRESFEGKSLFEVHDKNATGIWRTVVDFVKLKKLEDAVFCYGECSGDSAWEIYEEINSLLGQRKPSFPSWHVPYVLQTTSGFLKNKTYSPEFFDLSRFNRFMYDASPLIEIRGDYVPLDSIVRNAAGSIDI